jgi:peptide/nickel transport system substrate-binding protein
MRSRPIGTGPFKFVEFKPNESIRVTRNPDYWKKDRPYLDGIEYRIIPSISTRILGFVAGKFDTVTGVTVPLLKDVKSQAPQAICEVVPTNVPRTLLVNPAAPPFDNAELRRAMALTLDRKSFIDIITLGLGDIGGVMLPPPEGVWGMPADMLKSLPGYDPDVEKNRTAARKIMENLGYGPDKRLATKVSIRNIVPTRDPAVILIDQLKQIYIDGELETVDTTQWMRATFAAPNETMAAIAIRRSTSWSIGSRWRPTATSGGNWCGRSKGSWPRTVFARSSSTLVKPPAGSRG